MNIEKIAACFHEISVTVDDVTDDIFILFYIFDHCADLSVDDLLGFHRAAKKLQLQTQCTASQLFFAHVRNSYYFVLRTYITPRQNEKMKAIVDKHL